MEMKINGKPCMMELDTAADFSIMSKSEYLEKFADKPLTPSQVILKTYTGEVLEVSRKIHCDIVYKGKQYSLPILVANYDAKPTLLGTNSLRHIKLEWGEIFCIPKGDALSADSQLNDLLSKHSELFTESYEGMKSLEAHFTMRGDKTCICESACDILIGGNDGQENLKILADVLDRLHKYNLHLKLPTCEFLKPEVVYLGLRISAEGLQPVEEKINAVKQAPAPQNVSELRSFLGMVQYYQ